MGEKKLYSFKLDEDEIKKLDRIIDGRNVTRTAFIENMIRSYNAVYHVALNFDKPKNCDDCGLIYKTGIRCPNCRNKGEKDG